MQNLTAPNTKRIIGPYIIIHSLFLINFRMNFSAAQKKKIQKIKSDWNSAAESKIKKKRQKKDKNISGVSKTRRIKSKFSKKKFVTNVKFKKSKSSKTKKNQSSTKFFAIN